MERANNYFGIWNSRDIYDSKVFDDVREGIAKCNECSVDEVSDETVYELWNDYLEDERMNLNKELDGCIVALADLGFWNGRANGGKVLGNNLNSIFQGFGCDDHEWYADRYNVRGNFFHHDGTHHVVFRLAKDRDTAQRIVEQVAYNGLSIEQAMRKTKSIRPYVAKIYGWREFTKTTAQ